MSQIDKVASEYAESLYYSRIGPRLLANRRLIPRYRDLPILANYVHGALAARCVCSMWFKGVDFPNAPVRSRRRGFRTLLHPGISWIRQQVLAWHQDFRLKRTYNDPAISDSPSVVSSARQGSKLRVSYHGTAHIYLNRSTIEVIADFHSLFFESLAYTRTAAHIIISSTLELVDEC